MNAQPTRRRTAWHEAGHAVASWAMGFTVTLVSIRREGESYGRSQHAPAGDCSVLSERKRESIVAMAGWAAELASGEVGDGPTYDSGDLSWVVSTIDQHAPAMLVAELGWAESEAHRIVIENIDRVSRLASQLLIQEELSNAADIKKVIEGH
ncbi:hypothetical protein [Bradyrhizobium sp. B117]|uniref:hypothetical protein n=1 Tax=Bradyrhizobium sp. B117 TaxID=3140246 RepID=UPI0031839355